MSTMPEEPRAAIPPNTTQEEQLHTAAQRRINSIWELTQAGIAISITIATLFTIISLINRNTQILVPIETLVLFMLATSFFLVIGFYFGRTNHARIGDVPSGKIEGKIDSR